MAKSRLSTRNGEGRNVCQMFPYSPERQAPSLGFTELSAREEERNSVPRMEALEGKLLPERISRMIVGSIGFRSPIAPWVK